MLGDVMAAGRLCVTSPGFKGTCIGKLWPRSKGGGSRLLRTYTVSYIPSLEGTGIQQLANTDLVSLGGATCTPWALCRCWRKLAADVNSLAHSRQAKREDDVTPASRSGDVEPKK